MDWNDEDFCSDDPLIRHNAHQAAKGRSALPDPDDVRKAQKEGRQDAGPNASVSDPPAPWGRCA